MKSVAAPLLLAALVLCGCGSGDSVTTSASIADTYVPVPPKPGDYPYIDDTPAGRAQAKKEVAEIEAYDKAHGAPPKLDEPSAPVRSYTTDSMEYQIAYVDAGGGVTPDGPETARVGKAVDALQKRYGNSRQSIGDICTKGHELLKDKGIEEPVVEIMEDVASNAPNGMKNLADLVGIYVIEKTSRG